MTPPPRIVMAQSLFTAVKVLGLFGLGFVGSKIVVSAYRKYKGEDGKPSGSPHDETMKEK
jgi:hypothetical protein